MNVSTEAGFRSRSAGATGAGRCELTTRSPAGGGAICRDL